MKSDVDISRVRQLQKKFIFTTLSGSSPIIKEHKDKVLSTTEVEELSVVEFIELMN